MIVVGVELSQLFEVVWVSLLAGVAITTCFSLVVLGAGRMADAQRSGRGGAAFGYGALAGFFLLLFVGGVALGVEIMLAK
jgi:hypothetical protein